VKFEFTGVSELNRSIQKRLGERTEAAERKRKDKQKVDALAKIQTAAIKTVESIEGAANWFGFAK
jgi:hypothetical protein